MLYPGYSSWTPLFCHENELFCQDEADHKDAKEDGGENTEDLIAKAEKEFFEALEAEKKRREREALKKGGVETEDGEEKQDKGKVKLQNVRSSEGAIQFFSPAVTFFHLRLGVDII